MNIKKINICICIFIFTYLSVNNLILSQEKAQYKSLGSWNVTNFKYTWNRAWYFTLEAQLRSLGFYSNFHYHEFSQSTNFRISENLISTLGIGKYDTYQEGGNFVLPKNNDEIRIWPQITTFQNFRNITIEHRYRIEFRMGKNIFRNRYRYRLGIKIPLGKEKNGIHQFNMDLNNELFFTEKEPYFERNRLQMLINYKPNLHVNLQLGYLYQFDYKILDEIGRNFVMVGFSFNFIRKPKNIPVIN